MLPLITYLEITNKNSIVKSTINIILLIIYNYFNNNSFSLDNESLDNICMDQVKLPLASICNITKIDFSKEDKLYIFSDLILTLKINISNRIKV